MRLFTTAMVALFALGMFSVGSTVSAKTIQVPARTSTQAPHAVEAIVVSHKKKKKHKKKAHHHQMTAKTAKKDYLKDVAPANAAITTWKASPTAGKTGPELLAQAKPLLAALEKWQLLLEDTDWPSKDQAAADVLAGAIGQLDASLESLSTVNLLNEEEWTTSYADAANQVGVDANVMRHDLGLPPA